VSLADDLYTPRFVGPELLERGRNNTITCPVYRDGVLVAPTPAGSTVTVKKPDGTTLVAPTVTVVDSVATAIVTSAALSGQAFAFGYRVEWSLVLASGSPRTLDNLASVVRRALFPVITDLDLTELHPDLSRQLPDGTASFQTWIDAAWNMTQTRLIAKGNRPNLIIEPYALREYLRNRTLHLIFHAGATSRAPDGRYAQLAQHYLEQSEAAWKDLNFLYDDDDSGGADTRRRSAQPQTFLAAPEADFYGGDGYPRGVR
jgi:hypothetical protein